jgi:hypothetical protein
MNKPFQPWLPIMLVMIWCSVSPAAQQARVFGTIVTAAPVTLLPERGRTPLAVLDPGTQVEVLGDVKDGWYQVVFRNGFGPRIGYVRAESLRVSARIAIPSGREAEPSVVAPSASEAAALRNRLTDTSIDTAIFLGQRQKGQTQGLQLFESDQTRPDGTAVGTSGPEADRRVRLQIYTPLAWIQQLASDAAIQGRTFNRHDVTEEMKLPVLRLTAYGPGADDGKKADLRQTPMVISHVVLRGESRDSLVQPLSKEAFSEHQVTASGEVAVTEGLRLTFPMDGVRELRGPRGDRGFSVVVIGPDGNELAFELKTKHLADLPM